MSIPKGGIYNGKKYRILWAGETKYGKRVHLCWWSDETKEFWVDAEFVTPYTPEKRSSSNEMCAECGERAGVVECDDSSGIRAMCCLSCARLPSFERSFA